MPVHVEEMSSEVGVFDDDLPLSPAQLEKLVTIILSRLEQHQREARLIREATTLRPESTPPAFGEE